MIRKIRWSKTARQTYLNLLLDLQDDWGDKVAVKFDKKLKSVLATISRMPYIYPASEQAGDKAIRRCVISKQTSFYYRVSEDLIEIITFYDNRMNLDDLELS